MTYFRGRPLAQKLKNTLKSQKLNNKLRLATSKCHKYLITRNVRGHVFSAPQINAIIKAIHKIFHVCCNPTDLIISSPTQEILSRTSPKRVEILLSNFRADQPKTFLHKRYRLEIFCQSYTL